MSAACGAAVPPPPAHPKHIIFLLQPFRLLHMTQCTLREIRRLLLRNIACVPPSLRSYHLILLLRLRLVVGRLRLKCDGTRAETRFRLSAKRTGPFKSAGAPVQSTTGSRGVGISGSNAEYTLFQASVKSTGYPLHSPVSPSLPLPYVTVWHDISTGLYYSQFSSIAFLGHCLC
jgi:hypothetical protein